MKKLLIFLFLAFVSQIVMATIITLPPEQEQKIREQVQENLNCLRDKKAKLPTKYEGANLKLSMLIRSYGMRWVSTNMEYYIDSVAFVNLNERPLKETSYKSYIKTSSVIVSSCAEYVVIGSIDLSVYDVTNVPPNSFLKYIPETKEMQVITPVDKEYKKFMDEYKRGEKLAEEERLKELKLLREK